MAKQRLVELEAGLREWAVDEARARYGYSMGKPVPSAEISKIIKSNEDYLAALREYHEAKAAYEAEKSSLDELDATEHPTHKKSCREVIESIYAEVDAIRDGLHMLRRSALSKIKDSDGDLSWLELHAYAVSLHGDMAGYIFDVLGVQQVCIKPRSRQLAADLLEAIEALKWDAKHIIDLARDQIR